MFRSDDLGDGVGDDKSGQQLPLKLKANELLKSFVP